MPTASNSSSCTPANVVAMTVLSQYSSRTATTSLLYGKRYKQVDFHREMGDDDGAHQRKKQDSNNMQFIAKTTESFKLADLYWLESCVAAHCQAKYTPSDSSELLASGDSWKVRKLAFHRPTASYLLGCFTAGDKQTFNVDKADNFMDEQTENRLLLPPPPVLVNLPFRKDRCQYVAQVIATGQSPQEFLANISLGALSSTHEWTLDYDVFEPLQSCMQPQRSFSSTMLLCAVARILPGEPLLTPATQMPTDAVSYTIVETSSRLYLAQKLSRGADVSDGSASDLQNLFRSSWARRPFQYSGAINLDVAIAIIDILTDVLQRSKNPKPLRVLDPTCGSGTFLALALIMWGADSSVEVTGIDSNPKCSLGSAKNLQHLFHSCFDESTIVSSSDVESWSLTIDSNYAHKPSRATIYSGNAVHLQSFTSNKFDCAVANLPWNRNTFEFQGGIIDNKCINCKILEATAEALLPGSPLVVVSGGSQNGKKSAPSTPNELNKPLNARQCLESLGFEVLGEATVPPQGFHLPVSGKKSDVSTPQECILRSSDCLITVAIAPCRP